MTTGTSQRNKITVVFVLMCKIYQDGFQGVMMKSEGDYMNSSTKQ